MVNVSQSSLPLKEGYILFYSNYFVKVLKLHPRKGLDVNIYSLVICQNILELNHTFLHHITYELISNLYVLRLVVKYKIR